MDNKVKLGLYGLLTWLIPFLFAFLFYSRTGELLIDIFLFKSIMIVFAALVGVSLMAFYFKGITENCLKEGVLLGVVWFAINIVLDIAVLVPMSGATVGTWFTSTGMRYLIIPIMSIAIGYTLEAKQNGSQ